MACRTFWNSYQKACKLAKNHDVTCSLYFGCESACDWVRGDYDDYLAYRRYTEAYAALPSLVPHVKNRVREFSCYIQFYDSENEFIDICDLPDEFDEFFSICDVWSC